MFGSWWSPALSLHAELLAYYKVAEYIIVCIKIMSCQIKELLSIEDLKWCPWLFYQKLNEYLDGLTEHYDIPKVSWTK